MTSFVICFSETDFLLFRLSWPERHDHMRHFFTPSNLQGDNGQTYFEYCSSLTCSIQSTTLPSFLS